MSTFAGITDVLVSRTGYTGEDGFELYLAADQAAALWEKLLEAGKEDGLKPCGLGARDTLRLEARLALYGQELSSDISPLEAGIGFAVKTKKESDFIGKDALTAQKEEGLKRKLVGIEVTGRGIPRHGYKVVSEGGEEIGVRYIWNTITNFKEKHRSCLDISRTCRSRNTIKSGNSK